MRNARSIAALSGLEPFARITQMTWEADVCDRWWSREDFEGKHPSLYYHGTEYLTMRSQIPGRTYTKASISLPSSFLRWSNYAYC